jgi:tetratricopeptide (TPR) repeat protein
MTFFTAALLRADSTNPSTLLNQGRATLDLDTLNQARQVLEPYTNITPLDPAYGYQLVQTDYYLSIAYELNHQRSPGEKALESALRLALKLESQNQDNADIHSLLADIYSRKIVAYGDMFTGMDCGPKVETENKKALALNPNNALVQASLGRQYLLAPSAFGGDARKAEVYFQKSLKLNPKSDETYVWLARTYRKLKNPEKFESALQKALKLNPHNRLALIEKETAIAK